MMFSSGTCSATRWMRGMYRPSPTTVGSTMVAIPWAASARSLPAAPATRSSSLPHSCG